MIDFNGLIGKVLNAGGQALNAGNKVLDTPGKKLLAGGAAASLLLTETGRDVAGTALKYGGIAALGGLAYHAWQKHRAQGAEAQGGEEAAGDATPPSAFLPRDAAQQESLGRLLVTAMVTAAKADGKVDEEEQNAILGHAEKLELTAEEQSFLFAELAKPFDIEAVLKGVTSPEIAAEVYAASLIAVGQPSPAEQGYLRLLAKRLNLPKPVVEELHRAFPSAMPAAA